MWAATFSFLLFISNMRLQQQRVIELIDMEIIHEKILVVG